MLSYIKNGWREARAAVLQIEVTEQLDFYERERPDAQYELWSNFDRYHMLDVNELFEIFESSGLQTSRKRPLLNFEWVEPMQV
jgi:hypothetical protein